MVGKGELESVPGYPEESEHFSLLWKWCMLTLMQESNPQPVHLKLGLIPLGHDDTNLCFEPSNSRKQIYSSRGVIIHKNPVFQLNKPVKAEGNVEVWLMALMKMAHLSLHCVIRTASHAIEDSSFQLLEFLNMFPAQVSLETNRPYFCGP